VRRGRRGANVTDRRDWGEKGPGGSGWGAREKERTGQRWGTDMRARASRFKLDLKQKSKFKWFKTFSNHFKIGWLEKYFPLLRKIEIKYGFKLSKRGTSFSIEASSDSEWI
jgi:hypothetical protein